MRRLRNISHLHENSITTSSLANRVIYSVGSHGPRIKAFLVGGLDILLKHYSGLPQSFIFKSLCELFTTPIFVSKEKPPSRIYIPSLGGNVPWKNFKYKLSQTVFVEGEEIALYKFMSEETDDVSNV